MVSAQAQAGSPEADQNKEPGASGGGVEADERRQRGRGKEVLRAVLSGTITGWFAVVAR